jgi:hypothetical protein
MHQSNVESHTVPSTAELGDAIWRFSQNPTHYPFEEVLRDILTSGRLELAIEFMKLNELERIANEVETIRIDGLKLDPNQLSNLINS